MPTRSELIHKAASLPTGSPERKVILAKLAAKDFDSMTMLELEKAVAKSFPGSKHNRGSMARELVDGTLVMFSQIGGGPGQSEAKTFINVYKDRGSPLGRDIPVTSVADAVAKIKKNKKNKNSSLKTAVSYNGDPNVALESVLYNAKVLFVEDVAKAIIRYSGLKTPVAGKPGATFMRGSVAHGGLVNRTDEGDFALGVEVKASRGKIEVTVSSDLFGQKKFKFTGQETPASIGSHCGWVGQAYLMGERP